MFRLCIWLVLKRHTVTVDWHCCVVNVIMTFKLLACSFITFSPFNDYNCHSRWYIDIGQSPAGVACYSIVLLWVLTDSKKPVWPTDVTRISHAFEEAKRAVVSAQCVVPAEYSEWCVKISAADWCGTQLIHN